MSPNLLKKILYVEDEPDIRTIASMALESLGGFELECCQSGQEALDRAPGFEPDLILLDIMMPGMNGPSALQQLRKLPGLAETPVIFMTAKVQPQELAEYRALGALDVIHKPFDPMLLADQVREIWRTAGREAT